MRNLPVVALAAAAAVMLPSNAAAERPRKGSVEFAILGGLSSFAYESYYGNDNTDTYFALPSGSSSFPLSSMLRMSVWTSSSLIADLGFSMLNISDGGSSTVSNMEIGVGAAFGEQRADAFPFIGAVMGILMAADGNSDSEAYLGFQGGFRYFFREHAALRMQVGYRRFMGDDFSLESSMEIVGGLGFVI